LVTANAWDDKAAAGAYFAAFNAHAVHWNRVVVDEMHELDERWTFVERAVSSLTANIVWGLTATPNFGDDHSFTGKNRAGGYSCLLRVSDYSSSSQTLGSSHIVRSQFVQRAALTSGAGKVPPLTVHRVAVNFSAREMAIYASLGDASPAQKRLLYCSHHDAIEHVGVADDGQMQVYSLSEVSEQLGKRHAKDRDDAANAIAKNELALAAEWTEAKTCMELIGPAIMDVANTFVEPGNDETTFVFVAKTMDIVMDAVSQNRALSPLALYRRLRIAAVVARARAPDHPRAAAAAADSVVADDNADLITESRAYVTVAALVEFVADMKAEDRALGFECRRKMSGHSFALRGYNETLDLLRKTLADAEGRCNFFTNVFAEMRDTTMVIACPMCFDDEAMQAKAVLSACGHRFCVECAANWFTDGRTTCPMCRRRLTLPGELRTVNSAPPAPINPTDEANLETHGSKLLRLAALLEFLLSTEPGAKIIVFAQFERLLRLVARALTALKIGQFVSVRGTIHQCQTSINEFRTNPAMRIMLLSSETTISGITLVEANHVVAVHPPLSSEGTEREYGLLWQAVGRVRRIGQTRPQTHLWSLVTEDTLETEMFVRQTQYIRDHHADVTFEEQ